MRSSIVIKLFIAAGLALCIGFVVQNIMLHIFSNQINTVLVESMDKITDNMVRQNEDIFSRLESNQLEKAVRALEEQANRQVTAVGIYAIQPLEHGNPQNFVDVSSKLVEQGDFLALYAVKADWSYFAGAGAGASQEVLSRLGEEARTMRADKMAEELLKLGGNVKQYTAPIHDSNGTWVGEVRLVTSGDSLARLRNELDDTWTIMDETMTSVVMSHLEESRASLERSWLTFRRMLWVSSLISMILAAVALLFVTRLITRPLISAVEMADAIRHGDFKARLHTTERGEVGALVGAMNEMAEKVGEREAETREAIRHLGAVLNQVSLAAGEITSSASHLANSSQVVTSDAQLQEKLLQVIADSVQALGDGVTKCATNAGKASTLSSQAKESVYKGDEEMERMISAMGELSDSHAKVARAMKVIDEIAFQTNLLALNAAVEAARAGRHGKGFAVVADEVRNLAARSARSAMETEQLIKESQERLSYTSECLNTTGQTLRQIETGVDNVSALMAEIADISEKNAVGLDRVKSNVGQINEVAERNHMSAASAAATAEELLAMTAGLKDMLGKRGTIRPEAVGEKAAAIESNPSRNRAALGYVPADGGF